MNEYPFRRSRFWGWVSVIAFIAMPLIFLWVTLQPYLRSHDWNVPPFLILICTVTLLTFGSLAYSTIVQLLTNYGKEGIRQLSLSGSRFLAWRDVREVRNLTATGMELLGPDIVIHINFSLFEDQQGLVEGIRSRVPPSAYPEPGKRRQEEQLRRQTAVGFWALLNFMCAALILLTSRTLIGIVLAIVLLVLGIVAARKWFKLRDSQP